MDQSSPTTDQSSSTAPQDETMATPTPPADATDEATTQPDSAGGSEHPSGTAAAADQPAIGEQASESEASDGDSPQVKLPEFMPLQPNSAGMGSGSLQRFYDVEVTLTAELGRVALPIGELVALQEGSVIDLKQSINSPVELVAQGVRIASGEVVVIDDRFAIRIKEIESGDANQEGA